MKFSIQSLSPLLLLFLLLMFVTTPLSSQSASGMYQGYYKGIHGAIQNPSSAPNSYWKWDANLVGFNAFAATDYAFVMNTNLFHLLRNTGNLTEFPNDTDQTQLDPNLLYYDFKEAGSSAFASASIDVVGPSFLINFEKFSAGVFSRFRSQGGTHHIPAGLGYDQVINYQIGDWR